MWRCVLADRMADTTATFAGFDRAQLGRVADWLAVGVVITMPWSISASQILTAAWLILLIPTLDVGEMRRVLRTPAGALPVLLWLLGFVGILWADVSWSERLGGLEGYHKLLVIPLLLAQFRRSDGGLRVVYGYLATCTALLIASWGLLVLWKLWGVYVPDKLPGLLVKDYIAQSSEFLICTFGLLGFAADRWQKGNTRLACGALLLAGLFLANIFYVAPGRTAIVIMPALLLILGFYYFGWKGVVAAAIAGVVLAAVAWTGSPLLRARVFASFSEVQAYETQGAASSSAIRLELWKKSLAIIASAPIMGHGTGSTPEQFGSDVFGQLSVNPHNQIFAVAIPLGLIGTAVLLAMWLAHLALFRGEGLIAWIGIVMVVQNIASAPFNAHLFDSLHGWLYAFGVGVLGGIAQRERSR